MLNCERPLTKLYLTDSLRRRRRPSATLVGRFRRSFRRYLRRLKHLLEARAQRVKVVHAEAGRHHRAGSARRHAHIIAEVVIEPAAPPFDTRPFPLGAADGPQERLAVAVGGPRADWAAEADVRRDGLAGRGRNILAKIEFIRSFFTKFKNLKSSNFLF